jgi:hypothetical protein
MVLLVLLVLPLLSVVSALDNGVGRTPALAFVSMLVRCAPLCSCALSQEHLE